MLHVVTGDAAAHQLRASGVLGDILAWRDVLHDGPVPAGLDPEALADVRARWLADCGSGEYDELRDEFRQRDASLARAADHDEVVLWFEHDLFDQLHLIQLLDGFAAHPHARLSLVNVAEYLGMAGPERLARLFERRRGVRQEQLRLGCDAWAAFRASSPEPLEALLRGDTAALPFLRASLRRHLEEYPHVGSGLSRNERQILELSAEGLRRPPDIFRGAQALEDPVYLGDSSFWLYMAGLMQGERPLLAASGGAPAPSHDSQEFLLAEVQVTDAGRDVLGGRADWLDLHPIDRWLGGVHLEGSAAWRWDPGAGRIVSAAAAAR